MTPWPADNLERRQTAALVPYARNSRLHSDEQIAQISASIGEWGFTMPVLIDEQDGIIAGHARVLAARQLGLAELPVLIARGWSDAKKRAYVIADNRLALSASWDEELLKFEFEELLKFDFDLDLTGFSDYEIRSILDRTEGLTDPDDVPDEPAEPASEPGDVWILGRHRLVCGDCTDPAIVDKALNDVRPHLMVTDPPYGVNYDANWRNQAAINGATFGRKRGVIGGRAIGKVTNDSNADWRDAWALFPGDVAYVWHSGLHGGEVAESLQSVGFEMRSQLIWRKNNIVISRGHYHHQHEPCWYAVKEGKAGHWSGSRTESTVWDIPKPQKSESGHSAQKPVECMRRPIENNSSPGQAVYDPFVGSGTTIIAAEMTGRYCHAIEIKPAYVDVSITRWQNFAGQAAIHESTGKEFPRAA